MATSMPRGKQNRKQKDFQKHVKQNGENGRRLLLGPVFCHGAHTAGRNEEHGDED